MNKTIAIVVDAYPPSRSSAALQLHDLNEEFIKLGVTPTVIVPDSLVTTSYQLDYIDNVKVLRLKASKYKNIGNFRRAISECLMPLYMILNFRKSFLKNTQWDSIVWYSPSIFLGPFVYYLKLKNNCPCYLILRDIFPAWAIDLGLIKRGFAHTFFRIFEKFQYFIADRIGVQAQGNLNYFKYWHSAAYKKTEVLQNWLTPKIGSPCAVNISKLPINNRKIFVYAGNMGIAQGMGDLLIFAKSMLSRNDIGLLFIGRGSDMAALKASARSQGLTNTVFCDEIEPSQMPGLYAQCHVGLISLDARHQTHNIPGKFLSYLQSGLPVMAIVNKGNDLLATIEKYQVGKATVDRNETNLRALGESIIDEIAKNPSEMSARCKKLSRELYSTEAAAKQILHSINNLKLG